MRDNPYTGRKMGTMERNAHEEIITGTELATVPIPVGNSVVLPEGGSHLHHADDRDFITAATDVGIRLISPPTKTETDAVPPKGIRLQHFCVHAVHSTHAPAGRVKIYSCLNELSCSFEDSIYRLNFSTGLHIMIITVKAILIVS